MNTNATQSLASRKLEFVVDCIEKGMTVYVATALRVAPISPKTFATFKASGKPVVKVIGDSFYVIERGDYVCADYAKLSAR